MVTSLSDDAHVQITDSLIRLYQHAELKYSGLSVASFVQNNADETYYRNVELKVLNQLRMLPNDSVLDRIMAMTVFDYFVFCTVLKFSKIVMPRKKAVDPEFWQRRNTDLLAVVDYAESLQITADGETELPELTSFDLNNTIKDEENYRFLSTFVQKDALEAMSPFDYVLPQTVIWDLLNFFCQLAGSIRFRATMGNSTQPHQALVLFRAFRIYNDPKKVVAFLDEMAKFLSDEDDPIFVSHDGLTLATWHKIFTRAEELKEYPAEWYMPTILNELVDEKNTEKIS